MEKQATIKSEGKKQPSATFRAGSVQATIWEQPGKYDAPFYNVTIKRSYKDGEEWKETNSYNAQDLPKLALVTAEAFKWISLKEKSE